MSDFKRWLGLSDHPVARAARMLRHAAVTFSLPAPALIVRPLLAVFLALRYSYYLVARLFICEPLFKAYCAKYGRGLRTGVYVHWVTGSGNLVIGDNVLVDGKCAFAFAMRYSENPTLTIGSNTIISHGCNITVGRKVSIGNDCLIATGVRIFDAPGHPTDPILRKMGKPANPEDVRPVDIQDNVWVGADAIVFPGVTVGKGSVVTTGAILMSDVPPYSIVAGNPARVIAKLGGLSLPPQESEELHTIASAGGPSLPSLDHVMGILRQTLGTADLAPDEDFYDAGVTSIMTLPLLCEMELRFGIEIPEAEFLRTRTAKDLAAAIDSILIRRVG